jgi:ankyrin repeat protein
MVRHLLAMAPDGASWADGKGDTPLTLAVAGGAGRLPLVELLLETGADANAGPAAAEGQQGDVEDGGVRALHHAAAHDDVAVVKRLLAAGADAEAATDAGTALHWAAGEGAAAALRALLEKGADANATNAQGLTPLILAAAHGSGACVAALAGAGADVGFVLSGGGLTALHMLAEYGSEEGVMALLATEQGRKCALHESEHGKPVHLAAWGGHRGLVEALLPHSGVQESVEEMMAWGQARAAAYEEEQRAATAAHYGGDGDHLNQQHGHLGDRDVHHHGAMGLPPAAAGPEAAAEAQRKKEAANRAFVAQEYEAALALYGEAIALDGRDPAFWSNRAGCRMKLGDFEAALADAEVARALKPDWPKACYRMAEARLALKRYEDAALAAYEGIQLDGGNQALHRLLRQAIDLGREEHQQKVKAEAEAAEKGKGKNKGK